MKELIIAGMGLFHFGVLTSALLHIYNEKQKKNLPEKWAFGIALAGSLLVIVWAILRFCGVPQP